jgi:hypothetical protein
VALTLPFDCMTLFSSVSVSISLQSPEMLELATV